MSLGASFSEKAPLVKLIYLGIVWGLIRKQAHTQLVGEHSATVSLLSHCGLILA